MFFDITAEEAFCGPEVEIEPEESADKEDDSKDVLPEYRKQRIASALVSNLSVEILERNKVPFYCSAWSNLRSVKTAIACGFIPVWVEMTVKPAEIADGLNMQKIC